MPTAEQAFVWLTALPPITLYASAFGFAVVENVFPPFPADVFIGLCAFIAAPGKALVGVVFLSVLTGNVAGAAVTFELGRRYGAAGLRRRMDERGWLHREEKLEGMYARWGLLALFVGRLVPGVRPIVPVLAGALGIPAFKALATVAVASTIWYGVLIGLLYRVGANWEEYADDLKAIGQWGAGVGLVFALVVVGLGIWFLRKRRHGN